MKELHPWQVHPSELIQYAIKHVYAKSEFDNRIGYLLLDLGVETILKTFIMLPPSILDSKVSYTKRRQSLDLNFHELIEMAIKVAGDKLKRIDVNHIMYFHSLRNILYHEASSISIDKQLLNKYADLSVELLKNLLSVDLTQYMIQTSSAFNHEKEKISIIKDIHVNISRLEKLVEQFRNYIILYVKSIEPSFLSIDLEKQIPILVDLVFKGFHFEGSEIEYLHGEQKEKQKKEISQKLPKEIRKFLSVNAKYEDMILEIVTNEYQDFLANFVKIYFDFMNSDNTYGNSYNDLMREVKFYTQKYHPGFISNYNMMHYKLLEKIKKKGDTLVAQILEINQYLEKNIPDNK